MSAAGPESPFSVEIEGGALHGHRGGRGPTALVLHGGPGFPDYTGPLAAELQPLFTTIRYTQRGTSPSGGGPPYTVDAHVADAVAVLDALGVEQAWAIGHSWGGHLALHLAVAHPERLLGVFCICPLGAFGDVLEEFGPKLRRSLSPEQLAFVAEIDRRREQGNVTEQELRERFDILWPYYFADPATAPPNPIDRYGLECSLGTNASFMKHFERATLASGLTDVRLPALFVHGASDPLPARSSEDTAALIPGARVVLLEGVGHFPWLERPGSVATEYQRSS